MSAKERRDVEQKSKSKECSPSPEAIVETSESEKLSALDVTSEEFDSLALLNTPKDYKVIEQVVKAKYENLAALETALKRYGFLQLSKSKKKLESEGASTSSKVALKEEQFRMFEELRQKFLQQTQAQLTPNIRKSAKRHLRNLQSQMTNVAGPLSLLEKCVKEKLRCRVKLRNCHRINSCLEGDLIFFDKYMNLLLLNVEEKLQKRKYKYGVNNTIGNPSDCSDRLQDLGITLPAISVKSLNRKNVEITRHSNQLLVRGDQIVLISLVQNQKVLSEPVSKDKSKT